MFRSICAAALAIALTTTLAVGGATVALAKNDKVKGNGVGNSQVQSGSQQQKRLEDEVIDEVLDGIFGENDRTIIQEYVREKGSIGRTSLPPGIAKNLARGKPLPPGIAKRGLPDDLEGRLPKLRDGLERIIVGDDVTIVEEGTRVVVDILRGVLRGQ